MLLWETGGKVKRVRRADAMRMIGKAFWSEEVAVSKMGELKRGEIEFIDAHGWGRFRLDEKDQEKIRKTRQRAEMRRALKEIQEQKKRSKKQSARNVDVSDLCLPDGDHTK